MASRLITLCVVLMSSACSLAVDGTLQSRPARGDAGSLDAPTADGPTSDRPGDAAPIDAPPPDTAAEGGTAQCTGNADCRDMNTCNGAETCVMGRCMPGRPESDGAACDADFDLATPDVCKNARCEASRCGDAVHDTQTNVMEECDDGNVVDGDGCDADCTFTCSTAADCDNMQFCDGDETCSDAHRCVAGIERAPGTTCTPTGGIAESGQCQSGACRAANCGDGVRQTNEECDPAETPALPEGACRPDCVWTCEGDDECADDNDLCNGTFKCSDHICVQATTPVMCDDAEPCTDDSCDTTTGACLHARASDADSDGFSASSIVCANPALGGDCNDADANVYPGAPEGCDGIDTDCNPATSDMGSPTTFYRDGDGDGYGDDSMTMTACLRPAGYAVRNGDCHDGNGTVRPNQSQYYDRPYTLPASGGVSGTSFDYNCDGQQDLQIPQLSCSDDECRTTPPIIRCSPTTAMYACCSTGRSTVTQGWIGSRPDCGGPVTVSTCPTTAAYFCAIRATCANGVASTTETLDNAKCH